MHDDIKFLLFRVEKTFSDLLSGRVFERRLDVRGNVDLLREGLKIRFTLSSVPCTGR